jgi:hypothetical protein
VGPHGFDWAIGTWSCTSGAASQLGGPTKTSLTAVRSEGGGVFVRSTGKNFDNSWYEVYSEKTKTWSSPFILADGSYGSESTAQTGAKTVWTGPYLSVGSSKPSQIRDTISIVSASKYTDLGEYQSGDTWKTQYDVSCTKV